MPDIPFAYSLRAAILRRRKAFVGKNTQLLAGSRINRPMNISIGNNVAINKGVILDTSGATRITINDNVIIGPYTVIRSDDHIFERTDIPIRNQGHRGESILIKDDCWIGAHCVILKGVTIGEGAIIGASSVVTKDIPSYSIAMGCPAKVINYRKRTIIDN